MAQPTTSIDAQRIDPRSAYPRPPFTQKEALTEDVDVLEPRPDHGEESYVGSGRLVGLRTMITGGEFFS